MNIYSCVDHENIEKIFVLFYSIFRNSNNFTKLKFFIITDKIPECEVPEFLKNRLKIGILKFDEYWLNVLEKFNDNFYQKSIWCKSNLNFARFFIFFLFPELDRVIYLDWDMIVQEDIYSLFEYYNANSMIVSKLKNQNSVKKNIINENKTVPSSILLNIQNKFKTNLMSESFNSGFYIVSKDHFEINKIDRLINSLISIQIKSKPFKFGTQVVMNLLTNDLIFIDYKWNTNIVAKDSKIIHWCGKKKPWNTQDKIWYKYYDDFTRLNLNFKI